MGLLALLQAAGCGKDPLTQIVVAVDSDWDGFDRVRIEIEGFEDPVTVDADLDDRQLPRRFAIVHEGGPLGPIAVTVSAFVDTIDEPVLIEPRTNLFFVRKQTKLLKVDLLFDCISECMAGEACLGAGECVSSSRAAELADWTGDVDGLEKSAAGRVLEVDGSVVPVPEDGQVTIGPDGQIIQPEGGPPPDGGGSDGASGTGGAGGTGGTGGDDAGIDSGPPPPLFDYTPTNFDVGAVAMSSVDVAFDCGNTDFDSTSLTFAGSCGSEPAVVVASQLDGSSEAALLVMRSLSIAGSSSLRLTGSRPVILVVLEDASIAGTLQASAVGALPGPGVSAACATGAGSDGANSSTGTQGACGGSGGGFGTAGGDGGVGRSSLPSVSGGSAVGNSTLVPLRGGCSGGRGGIGTGSLAAPGGGGGGAVQLSVAGTLTVSGVILAAGGGGQVGNDSSDGGGGGGSGGAILLEAGVLVMDAAAVVTANGGAGAGGQSTSTTTSEPGADGTSGTQPAAGGNGGSYGGDGGDGAAEGSDSNGGGNGSYSIVASAFGGGGGGGGGVGRIRINRAPTCSLPGTFSPAPSVEGCP